MKKVSVIVPVYNTSNYLNKCIESLVNQTLKDIEIILVNDGSTDNSKMIMLQFKDRYPAIIKYYEKENGGLSDARNYGMSMAKGEFISFIDSDDYIDLDMLEKMYMKIKSEKTNVCECDFCWEFSNKNIIDTNKHITNNLLVDTRVMVCNKLFKKDFIIKNNYLFPLNLRYEDVFFTYQYLSKTKKISYVNETLYHYLQRGNSLSNFQNEKVRDIFIILDKVFDYYNKNNIYDDNRQELEYLCVRYILGSSFLRTIKIKDIKIRKAILEEAWLFLYKRFPCWKENEYLKKLTFKNLYFNLINKPLYYLCSHIFRLKK